MAGSLSKITSGMHVPGTSRTSTITLNGIPGLAWPLEDVLEEIKFDMADVAAATLSYTAPVDVNGSGNGQVSWITALTSHPTYNWLRRTSATVRREEGGFVKVQVGFTGVGEYTNFKLYKVNGATSTEPIETHPNFLKIGGVPSAPKNGAIFDPSTGKFLGFRTNYPSAKDLNPKAGMRSYLVGGCVYQEDWLRGSAAVAQSVDLSELGTICTPPPSILTLILPSGGYEDGGAKGGGGGGTSGGDSGSGQKTEKQGKGGSGDVHYDWLLISADAEQIGWGSRLVRKWRLSGPRGWDKDTYPKAAGKTSPDGLQTGSL